jgi:hypothetical protein
MNTELRVTAEKVELKSELAAALAHHFTAEATE